VKLTENNIPRLITFLPSIGIILTTLIITFLIVQNGYKTLNFETNQIRKNFIKNEKENLKDTIKEVLNYIKYTKIEDNKKQASTINFIKNIISKRNGYIFIIDDMSNVVYHPSLKVGMNTSALKNIDGLSVSKLIIDNAKDYNNGTFITYFWNKVGETKKREKITYVYNIKEWNWIIAIDSYLDEIEKQIDKKVNYQEKVINENIINTILIAIIIASIMLIISYFFSKIIKKIFYNYRKTILNKERKLKKLANEEKNKSSKKEKEIEVMYKDILTGLPNRLKLSQALNNNSHTKLIKLNINRFTDINNFYSSEVADKLLKLVAKFIVKKYKNSTYEVYKLPVDEYAILSTSEQLDEIEFIKSCKSLIEEIEAQPFKVLDNEIIVSITGGIALTSKNTYINADAALKIAKDKHKDFFVLNEKNNMDVNFQNNIKWTKILKTAVEEDRVVVFKQPIINNITKTVKYECLVRIKEKDGNIISPFAFLDIAKKIKLYPKLTEIVVEKAFKHFEKQDCDFSINLTLDDIMNENTVNFIKNQLELSGIANRVIFEIVESEGIDNYEEVSLFIKNMKEYGCKIAIDDFGTGYSNFGYLMQLNVDFIKIDGSFIKNIDVNKQSQIITDLIITFAKKQNIETVAEFVHSESVLKKVESLGITYSQGYYLGEPKECEL
jgi:EAL domain-containing protein (putative c-di-GMP-specific phosphodiesterase class I)